MKREIIFRGLRTDGKGWAYGSLMIVGPHCNQFPCILEKDTERRVSGSISPSYKRHDVNPSTVGQFTGLFDRNGVRIFEGDNVTVWGKEYFIRFNAGVFVAESLVANRLSLRPWEYNGTDITVTGKIHEQ